VSAYSRARAGTFVLPRWAYGVLGGVAVLCAWQGIVDLIYSGHGTIPSPAQIALQFWSDGAALYFGSAVYTLRSAAIDGFGEMASRSVLRCSPSLSRPPRR
jgi:ABC-type nitrate/sulfonate/bicarbonate transport system permease component